MSVETLDEFRYPDIQSIETPIQSIETLRDFAEHADRVILENPLRLHPSSESSPRSRGRSECNPNRANEFPRTFLEKCGVGEGTSYVLVSGPLEATVSPRGSSHEMLSNVI